MQAIQNTHCAYSGHTRAQPNAANDAVTCDLQLAATATAAATAAAAAQT